MRLNLTSGKEAFMATLSRSIPRNSIEVEGPIVFSSDKGTLIMRIIIINLRIIILA